MFRCQSTNDYLLYQGEDQGFEVSSNVPMLT